MEKIHKKWKFQEKAFGQITKCPLTWSRKDDNDDRGTVKPALPSALFVDTLLSRVHS